MVLALADNGSLLSFLERNTVTWPDLCRMLLGIGQGLSHLHSDLTRNNNNPSVCHRDVNSRNILVTSDLTCKLCDFGLALEVKGNNDNPDVNDTVGTVRYMSPELLEGSLNLRDCESALKQVDIYAMGLTFWEASKRCRDLYQGARVPAFELAFEHELGGGTRQCTVEQMQILVSRNKARPLFPSVWKDSNPAVQLLRETIEYSWDQDGEARLTALGVVERIKELEGLWERYQRNKANKASPQNNSSSSGGAREAENETLKKNNRVNMFHNNGTCHSRRRN